MIWRAGIALIIVEAAIGLAIGTYIYRSFKHFHYERTGAFLSQVCPTLAHHYTDALGGHDAQSSQGLASRDGEQTGLRITVVALGGEVLADSAGEPEAMENHRNREEIAQALALGTGSSIRYSETLGREMFYFALRVDNDGRPVGSVRIATPRERVDRQLAGLLRTIVLGAAVWIGTTIVAIVFFSTRPRRQSRAWGRARDDSPPATSPTGSPIPPAGSSSRSSTRSTAWPNSSTTISQGSGLSSASTSRFCGRWIQA